MEKPLLKKHPHNALLITLFSFTLISQVHISSCSIATKKPFLSSNFLVKSCSSTTYPSQCIKTLTPFSESIGRNPINLINAALNVSIQSAANCSNIATKLYYQKGLAKYDAKAIKDCIGDLKDAVSELKQTSKAIWRLKGGHKDLFQWANAKTYASAAITDADTCVDGFSGRKVDYNVKKKIKCCVSGFERVASNALSLINHLY